MKSDIFIFDIFSEKYIDFSIIATKESKKNPVFNIFIIDEYFIVQIIWKIKVRTSLDVEFSKQRGRQTVPLLEILPHLTILNDFKLKKSFI